MKSRRKILAAMGTTAGIALAGCLGDNGDDWPDPPDEETPTEELLPDTDRWVLDEVNEQEAGFIGANDGIQGRWDGPDNERYTMEIFRFSDESSAEESAEEYTEEFGWFLSLSHGVFSFAVNGPHGVHARELLAASPALNEAIVAEKTPETDGFPSGGDEEDETEDGTPEESEEDETEDRTPEEAIDLVEEYYDALTQGDTDGVTTLYHPDSPTERPTEDVVSEMSRFDYEFEEIEVVSIDDENATVTGVVIITQDEEVVEEIEFRFELRRYDDEWRLW